MRHWLNKSLLALRVKFVGVKLIYKTKEKIIQLLPVLNGTMNGKIILYPNGMAIFCSISWVLVLPSKEQSKPII